MLAASNAFFVAIQEHYYIEMLKRNWWAVITIGQLFFRFFEHQYTADTTHYFGSGIFVSQDLMTSNAAGENSFREKRTPPPSKRGGSSGPPPTGELEAFPVLAVTRETQYRKPTMQ